MANLSQPAGSRNPGARIAFQTATKPSYTDAVSLAATELDFHRAGLLTEAFREGDELFLILHIIKCHNTLGQPQGNILAGPAQTAIDFKIINKLLGADQLLSPRFLRFCTGFPQDLVAYKERAPAVLLQCVSNIIACSRMLDLHWQTIRDDCRNAGIMPLPQDLFGPLAMPSPTLQRCLISYLASETWGDDNSGPNDRIFHYFLELQANFLKFGPLNDTTALREYNRLRDMSLGFSPSVRPVSFIHNENDLLHLLISRPYFSVHQSSVTMNQASPVLVTGHSINRRQSKLSVSTPTQRSSPVIGESSPPQIAATHTTAALHRPTLPLQNNAGQTSNPASQQTAPLSSRIPAQNSSTTISTTINSATTHDSSSPVAQPHRPRIFQYVAKFDLRPTAIANRPLIQSYTFELTQDDLDSMPGRQPQKDLRLSSSSSTFRLRCCRFTSESELQDSGIWLSRASFWPSYVYWTVNDHDLIAPVSDEQLKFKPIPLQTCLKVGVNTLKIFINRPSDDNSPLDLAVAIERTRFNTAEDITALCLNQRMFSSDAIFDNIVQSLSRQKAAEDDDLITMDASVIIKLFEPFSKARIFDIPVRGASCTHREAFDLTIFLETRPLNAQQVSKPDAWRCPICNNDVRPCAMLVDGFLAGVREVLANNNLLHASAIKITLDKATQRGKWDVIAKAEPAPASNARTGASPSERNTAQNTSKAREVIELSDDEG